MNNRPEMPPDLTGDAKSEWERVIDELETLGGLDETDRAVVEVYSRTYGLFVEAYRHVLKNGQVVKLPNGYPGPNPFLKPYLEHGKLLRSLLVEMGLTPAARKKMGTTTPEPEANPFAEL